MYLCRTSALPAQTAPYSSTTPLAPLPMNDQYVRLIVGSTACAGMLDDYASRYLADHLQRLVEVACPHAGEYAPMVEQLRFCTAIEKLILSAIKAEFAAENRYFYSLSKKERAADPSIQQAAVQVLEHIREHDKTLIPACYLSEGIFECGFGHMMYVLFSKEYNEDAEPAGTYKVQLFNTGGSNREGDWQKYHEVSTTNGKWQTLIQVGGVKLGDGEKELNLEKIIRGLSLIKRDQSSYRRSDHAWYEWVISLGQLIRDPSLRGQALQKVGSCTHKGLMAVLRYHLSDAAFNEAKARLLEDAAEQRAALPYTPHAFALTASTQRKALAARQKADGAKLPDSSRKLEEVLDDANRPKADVVPTIPATIEFGEQLFAAGSVTMSPGRDQLFDERFAPTSAVYFPHSDGKSLFVVLSNEPDLARNVYEGRIPEGSFQRLHMRVTKPGRLLPGSGKVGMARYRGESNAWFISQQRVRGSVSATEKSTAEGLQLSGNFSTKTSTTGTLTKKIRYVIAAGHFKAAPLDMRNRQLARNKIEGFVW